MLDTITDAVLGSRIGPEIAVDGRYVTACKGPFAELRQEVLDRLASKLANRVASDFPRVIIAFGKCRVGSTALTNAIGRSGIPAFFQPFKSVLRQALCGEEDLSHFDAMLEEDTVFCKEMFGPYTQIESAWNPFLELPELGFPLDKITLVWLERDPFDAFTSWVRNWGGVVDKDTLLEHFELASKSVARAARAYEQRGVSVLRFNYDSLSQHPNAVFNLLHALNIVPADTGQVTQWGESGDLASQKSSIIFTREPAAYGKVKVHSNRPEYKYVPQLHGLLDESIRDELKRRGLYGIYEDHRAACLAKNGSDGMTFASGEAGK